MGATQKSRKVESRVLVEDSVVPKSFESLSGKAESCGFAWGSWTFRNETGALKNLEALLRRLIAAVEEQRCCVGCRKYAAFEKSAEDGDVPRLKEIIRMSDSGWGHAAILPRRAGGRHGSWWMERARLREMQFPADVVPIFQKQVDAIINQKSSGGYAGAVKLLGRINGLTTRFGGVYQFVTCLVTVRVTHKPKRNFIKMTTGL